MAIAKKLSTFLNSNGITFELVSHPRTGSSQESAEEAHIPGDRLAKAVVVKTHDHYAMVVIPADYHLDLEKVGEEVHNIVGMATEEELSDLFPDCARGAAPPVGDAYGIQALWDSHLGREQEVYFEAGDHESLVKVSGDAFRTLMGNAREGLFSHHV